MAKTKTAWFCRECGYESAKWLGRCSSCGAWNSMDEEVLSRGVEDNRALDTDRRATPTLLTEVKYTQETRISLQNGELDRLLGGGLVEGSLVLLGGEPGIGKSTLSLQIPLYCPQLKTLYVSGEESLRQLKLRADRLAPSPEAAQNCHVLCETLLENILAQAVALKPSLLIIDSIQTVYSQALESSPGSVSQVRECAVRLLHFAKSSNTPVILIGHITKEGSIAGPKVLEHIVDVVLQFEGDNKNSYRILRGIKNRFGSVAELAVFEMLQKGLREVQNPSEILIPMHAASLSGIAVAAIVDGSRPFLMETQALVSSAAYGTPQRSATGFDVRRLNMLLAVLEKRAGFKLAAKDVFLNMAGGLKVNDPAVDLSVTAAILSSNFDIPLSSRVCFASEVGLSGEVRPVSHIDRRIAEAQKLGFEKIYISSFCGKIAAAVRKGIEVVPLADMAGLCRAIAQENKD